MKLYLTATIAICGMVGAYWLGRSSNPADRGQQEAAKTSPAVEITDESIRIVPGVAPESLVQKSDDGSVQIEGQLTVAPAAALPGALSGNKEGSR